MGWRLMLKGLSGAFAGEPGALSGTTRLESSNGRWPCPSNSRQAAVLVGKNLMTYISPRPTARWQLRTGQSSLWQDGYSVYLLMFMAHRNRTLPDDDDS